MKTEMQDSGGTVNREQYMREGGGGGGSQNVL